MFKTIIIKKTVWKPLSIFEITKGKFEQKQTNILIILQLKI
jgi:hypothetical protein